MSKEDLQLMSVQLATVEHVRLHKVLSQGKELDQLQKDLETDMNARFVGTVDEQAGTLLAKDQTSVEAGQENLDVFVTPPPAHEPERAKKGSSAKTKIQGTYSKVKAAVSQALNPKKKGQDKDTSKLPDGAQGNDISGVTPLPKDGDPKESDATLKAREKRQQYRQLAQERRDVLYGVRRVDEVNFADKLKNPELDLEAALNDDDGYRRTGIPREDETFNNLTRDTFVMGAVRYDQLDTQSRISISNRDDVGTRLAQMLSFEPRSEDFPIKEDTWKDIERLLIEMKDTVKPKAVRLALRWARDAMHRHRNAMNTMRNMAKHPRLIEAVQLLRSGYEDCQNTPFIMDLVLRFSFIENTPAARDEKTQVIKELKLCAQECERFISFVVEGLEGHITIDRIEEWSWTGQILNY